MRNKFRGYLLWLLLGVLPAAGSGQSVPAQTHQYSIEVAGVRVGRLTAQRQPTGADEYTDTLISDVEVNLLLYRVRVYYKVVNRFKGTQLIQSAVDARTNRGTFGSRTTWTGERYLIRADQYKYHRQAIEDAPIDFTVTHLYFQEPQEQPRAYGEYFGDFFRLVRSGPGRYRATFQQAEDEYQYEQQQLVRVTKRNKLAPFVIRRISE
jgi:hypothetical protein